MWLVVQLGVLPEPVERVVGPIVYTGSSLACPLFLLSLYLAPGLYRDAFGTWGRFWERLRSRKNEIADLQAKISRLNKAHHYTQLGAIFARQGDPAKAAWHFEQSLEREPGSLEATYRLALCQFDLKQFDKAAESLERVHAVRPDHDYGHAYLRLAQSHQALGNLDRASVVFAEFLRFYPGHPEGTFHSALLAAQRDDLPQARRQMEEVITAVRLSPGYQRRRNRHWSLKARWWLWKNRG
jgi:tetratricopeptide (TPR) repeat protein